MGRLRSVPTAGMLVALAVLGSVVVGSLGPWAQALGPLTAAVGLLTGAAALVCTLLATALRRGRRRLTWALLSVTVVCWTLSDLVWGVPFRDLASPVAGVGVLLAGYASAAGALVWAGAAARPQWTLQVRRRVADATVVVCTGTLLTSFLSLRPFLTGEPGVVHTVVLLTPVLSVALAGLSLVVSGLGAVPRVELQLLSMAFAAIALADATSVGLLAHVGRWEPAAAGGYAAASVLVAAAALSALGLPGSFGPAVERLGRRLIAAVPEVIVVLAGMVAIVMGLRTWLDWAVIALGGVATVWRSTTMALDARRSREVLEREVAARVADLSRLTRRYARILDTVREGIVGVDDAARVSFVNAAASGLLGVEQEDVLGLPVCEVLCDDAEHVDCPFVAVAQGRGRLEGWRTSLPALGGRHLAVELDAAPKVWPGAGEVEGAVIAFRDVSQQVAVEQHKQQFVSSVSHELRTPLASIRGVLELLGEGDAGELSPTARRLVQTAERGAERLTRLVGDIIDAERLAVGDFDVLPVVHDLGSVVSDAVVSLRPLATQAGVTVRLDRLDRVEVLCDADRIEQAVVNLIGNAVKFSDRGGVVEVEVRALAAEVEVMVRDQGRGIPAADLDHVFDRFRQVRATDATEKGGTGLGLTITRSIVERHGGRIRVESEEGDGATFTFTLQRAADLAVDRLTIGPVEVDHAS